MTKIGTEQDRLSEYAEFVAALPSEHEVDLVVSTNVSTAFFKARRAGWTVEQLWTDALYALRRGGIGMVVSRLNALAASTKSPIKETPARPVHDCNSGWLEDNEQGKAVPCPICKPHLGQCSECGIWVVKGIGHRCLARK